MDDLLREFLTETVESLQNLDVELVRLEQNPNDPELIGNIFRLVHTIKGTCGFLGLPRLESLAHAAENVLGRFRDGTLEVSADAVTLILDTLDQVKSLIATLEQQQAEPEGDDSALIARLDAMASSGGGAKPATKAAPEPAKPAPAPQPEKAAPAPAPAEATPAGTLLERLGGTSSVDCAVELMLRKSVADPDLNGILANVDTTRLQGAQVEALVAACAKPDAADPVALRAMNARLLEHGLGETQFDRLADHFRAALKELDIAADAIEAAAGVFALSKPAVQAAAEPAEPAAPAAEAAAAPPVAKAAPAEGGEAKDKESAIAAQTIRVSVDLLENLMTMVSELVLTRNQLLQMVRKHEDSEFKVPLQRLSHVTTDLQEGVMKTRMQPIGNAWGKLPRIVRDLSRELGKKIDLQMHGAETELDRQVLEMIKDPLTHMVRNSGDHGLEGPQERVKAGKPPTGTITLNAYHEGGHIIIEIADDGRGINTDKVKAKALASGLATEAELEAMTPSQINQFIFRAGLSTAEKVTSVSGRGVGMDVVRTNIEKIGGHVELRSTPGKGSTFVIKIPLTLAIVSALIVESGGERFAIPQISVDELVRVSSASEHRIEVINDTPVLRLRDKLLPLVDLGELLKITGRRNFRGGTEAKDGATPVETETFIIVAKVGTQNFGIIVDRVFDTEEIVVKPVSPILRTISIYSGNTILGDGSVVMILDPNGIASAAGEVAVADNKTAAQAVRERASGERVAFLVFRAGGETPKAVPLALVARLEEIDRTTIERSNGRPVVQYRGQLMPLLPVDPAFQLGDQGRQPVVVFTDRDRSMGLLVDEIVDIVEDRMQMELQSETPGVAGSAVIAGKTTDVLDTSHFLAAAFADWFDSRRPTASEAAQRSRVLLVDDSAFFRNLLAPLLVSAGYDVTSVPGASEALQLREAGEAFDIIVSDIEMPGMDGFALAREVRQRGRWQKTPIVALSSHTAPADLARGRDVGFVDYVAKLDRDALLSSLSQAITTNLPAERGAA